MLNDSDERVSDPGLLERESQTQRRGKKNVSATVYKLTKGQGPARRASRVHERCAKRNHGEIYLGLNCRRRTEKRGEAVEQRGSERTTLDLHAPPSISVMGHT
jgi:hypothetical protein